MNELALFAGAGGGILGGHLLGWRTICAVEWEPYPASVLISRQNDGILPPFPVWDDVQTFDGRPWRGRVDVISGGFPCQDISSAGKGAGIEGKKSGLWKQMHRIIGEVRPRFVLVENSANLTVRGGTRVSADLASMGYMGYSGVLSAADAIWNQGTPCADHLRERMWFVAQDSHSNSMRELQQEGREQDERGRFCDILQTIPDAECGRLKEQREARTLQANHALPGGWWRTEPGICRVAHGVAARVDRLKAIGNGQVPAVVPLAWNILKPG
jgi:DNA (cytosine-5)-methyltransferase 1